MKGTDEDLKRITLLAIAFMMLLSLVGCAGNGIECEVKSILEEDLESSITITELYYNEENQVCLTEFETKHYIDVALVYLESGKIKYESDFDYYTAKFNSATDATTRGKYSSKVLEYADLAMWKFAIAAEGATDENGWKKIK